MFLSIYLTFVISCFSCDGLVSNRLSRESSQDILVEDIDRLSTTSAMSESSVSHRLNDVQDVQDIARMQEESEKNLTNYLVMQRTFCPVLILERYENYKQTFCRIITKKKFKEQFTGNFCIYL